MSKLSQAAHVYTDGSGTRKRWIIFGAGVLTGLLISGLFAIMG